MPLATSARTPANGPGTGSTARPRSRAMRTRRKPGSLTTGMPASLTSATVAPASIWSANVPPRASSVWSSKRRVGLSIPKCVRSLRVWRGSSQRARAAGVRASGGGGGAAHVGGEERPIARAQLIDGCRSAGHVEDRAGRGADRFRAERIGAAGKEGDAGRVERRGEAYDRADVGRILHAVERDDDCIVAGEELVERGAGTLEQREHALRGLGVGEVVHQRV